MSTERPLAPKDKLVKAISALQAEVNSLQEQLRSSQNTIQRLQQECNQWQNCLDLLDLMLVVVKPDGTLSLINKKGRRVLGLRLPEEYHGRLWHQLCFEPAVGEAVWFLQKKLLEGEIEMVKHYETPVLTRFGWSKTIAWRSLVLRDEENKPCGLLHCGREFTERAGEKAAEPPKQVRYRLLLEVIPVPIHVIDRSYSLLLFNPAFQEWNRKIGLPLPAVGQNLFSVFPFLPPRVRQEYEQVFQSGQELITREKTEVSGRVYFTETRKIPLKEEDRVVQIMTMVQEVPSTE